MLTKSNYAFELPNGSKSSSIDLSQLLAVAHH